MNILLLFYVIGSDTDYSGRSSLLRNMSNHLATVVFCDNDHTFHDPLTNISNEETPLQDFLSFWKQKL